MTARPIRVPTTAPTILPADKSELVDVFRAEALIVAPGPLTSVGVPSVNEVVGVNKLVFTMGVARVGVDVVVCLWTEEVELMLEEVVLELVVVEEAIDVGAEVEIELEVVVVSTTGGVEVVDWAEEDMLVCLGSLGDREGESEDVDVGVEEDNVAAVAELGDGISGGWRKPLPPPLPPALPPCRATSIWCAMLR